MRPPLELELPPLTPAEAGAVLQCLGDLTSTIVLVGGQALAFWVERYADRFASPGPINSKDIDFCGSRADVATAVSGTEGAAQGEGGQAASLRDGDGLLGAEHL